MYLRLLLQFLSRALVPFAVLTTTYLYLYPIFHGCAFPSTNGALFTSFRNTLTQHISIQNIRHGYESQSTLAPFRLLVLADPQLEGDSSLPDPEDGLLQRLSSHWNGIAAANRNEYKNKLVEAFQDILKKDIPTTVRAWRKRLDLFGNDYYLSHIYRSLHWWTKPTHVTVLGDLIGSQWVTDEEFEWRGWRYWNRVLTGGSRVPHDIMTPGAEEKEKTININDERWRRRIINIAGNHDIGYAGDISKDRIDRFERVFGMANWDVRFEYGHKTNMSRNLEDNPNPSIHMVVLNSLILDTPALSEEMQGETYSFLNSIITKRIRPVEDQTSFLLLLTHLPLHKKEGICVDGPFFGFWGDDDGGGLYRAGGLREQNHLSQQASQSGTLEALFGMSGNVDVPAEGKGRNGLILTGHDHEGCDVWHYIPTESTRHWNEKHEQQEETEGEETNQRKTQWEAMKWNSMSSSNLNRSAISHTGVREITLRSMMGEFGGNAGLLSLWFDFEIQKWQYDFQSCQLGVQHIWWAIHILDIVTLILVITNLVLPSPRPKTKDVSSKLSKISDPKPNVRPHQVKEPNPILPEEGKPNPQKTKTKVKKQK